MDALDSMAEAEALLLEHAIARTRPRPEPGPGPGRGICVACGGPIAPARLLALPSARTCIDCQREIEG